MNHRSFEEWLLSGETLSAEEEKSLQDHLATCNSCPPLAEAWKLAAREIKQVPAVHPRAGFTQRWELRLQEVRYERQRRVTFILLGLFILGAIGLAYLSVVEKYQGLPSLLDLVGGMVFSSTAGLAWVQRASGTVEAIVRAIPTPVSILFWFVGASTLFLWTLVWIVTLWKLPLRQGVINHE
jgi:anti-sigma factor RsiW